MRLVTGRSVMIAAGLVLASLVGLTAPAHAQFGFYGEGGGRPLTRGHPDIPGGFTFCRLQYERVRQEAGGLGWSTDYPRADMNLTLRLSELTPTPVSAWSNGTQGIGVFRPTDPEIFRCPFLMASDAGTAGFNRREVEALRDYFLKGGFLWADDFWGNAALDHFLGQMLTILPWYQPVELPLDHPLYSIVYDIQEVPQITALQFWSPGGSTSERGAESAVPKIYAIMNDEGRILVLMSHNTDIADGWEREADDPAFFYLFSPDAYAIGINVAMWIMTH